MLWASDLVLTRLLVRRRTRWDCDLEVTTSGRGRVGGCKGMETRSQMCMSQDKEADTLDHG